MENGLPKYVITISFEYHQVIIYSNYEFHISAASTFILVLSLFYAKDNVWWTCFLSKDSSYSISYLIHSFMSVTDPYHFFGNMEIFYLYINKRKQQNTKKWIFNFIVSWCALLSASPRKEINVCFRSYSLRITLL